MFVVMGATGHVGSAVVRALLARGEAVTVVTHDAARIRSRGTFGVEIAEAEINDVGALHAAFRRGRRAFLLNPPADVRLDTDVVERRTVAAILAALDGSGLDKVVAASTYGAQPGERIGDLNTLWELEEGLRRQPIPAAINRAAYYYSNWLTMLEGAAASGALPTMIPAGLAIPMVAPEDLGLAAAERLLTAADDVGIRYVEGPRRLSPNDVAAAVSKRVGRTVEPVVVPRDRWEAEFRAQGFSAKAARSYTRMTEVSVDSGFAMPESPTRGATTIDAFLRASV